MGEGKTLILPQRIALSPYPTTVTYKRHWVQKFAYTTRQGDAVTGERDGGLGASLCENVREPRMRRMVFLYCRLPITPQNFWFSD